MYIVVRGGGIIRTGDEGKGGRRGKQSGQIDAGGMEGRDNGMGKVKVGAVDEDGGDGDGF